MKIITCLMWKDEGEHGIIMYSTLAHDTAESAMCKAHCTTSQSQVHRYLKTFAKIRQYSAQSGVFKGFSSSEQFFQSYLLCMKTFELKGEMNDKIAWIKHIIFMEVLSLDL